MKSMKAFSFSTVILGSNLDLALVGQASLDGFLSPGASEDLTASARRERKKQEALTLLVLFDKIILPDSTGGNYRIPILEKEGVLRIDRDERHLEEDFAGSNWYRNRDPQAFIRVLDRTVDVRPLVLDYIDRRKFVFVDLLAQTIGHTRKEIINSIIDLAHYHYLEDKKQLRMNILVQELPSSLIRDFRKSLNSQRPRDGFNAIDTILFGAALAGARLDYYARRSGSLGAGVATSEFSGQGHLWNKRPEIQVRSENMAEAFTLVRAALHEEMKFFPRIEGIKHALKLRTDPNLKAFRDQLALFQQGLIRGDGSDIFRLVQEVHSSAVALRRLSLLQRGLDWLTFASLPLSVVETLFQGSPVASLSLSFFSLGATIYNIRVSNRHRWVLFGR